MLDHNLSCLAKLTLLLKISKLVGLLIKNDQTSSESENWLC